MQSWDDNSLKICITYTIHVITTIRTTKKDTMLSCIAIASSSRCERHLALSSILDIN